MYTLHLNILNINISILDLNLKIIGGFFEDEKYHLMLPSPQLSSLP